VFVVDGLSRQGSADLFGDATAFSDLTPKNYVQKSDFFDRVVADQSTLESSLDGTDYKSLYAKIVITGFCFTASALSDFLSIVILLAHIALASVHTI
jgi:dienelactone hydrolase